jgi:hypothetical protein
LLKPGATAIIILIFFVKEFAINKHESTTTIFGNIRDLFEENKPFVISIIITRIFCMGAVNFSFIILRASLLGLSQSFIPIVWA